MEIKRNKT